MSIDHKADSTSIQDIEPWDGDFLAVAFQLTDEAAAAAAASRQNPNPNPPPLPPSLTPFHQPQPNPNCYVPAQRPDRYYPPFSSNRGRRDDVSSVVVSHSPPRELSQRPEPAESNAVSEITVASVPGNGSHGGRSGGKSQRDSEIEKLKRELDRISKKLKRKEHECEELHKDKETIAEQFENALLEIGDKDAEIYKLKSININHNQAAGQSAVLELKNQNKFDNGLTSSRRVVVQDRSVGVQTNTVQDGDFSHGNSILPMEHDILSRLHAIWGFPGENMLGRNLVSKLFVTCSEDLCTLFKYMSISSKINLDSCSNGKCSDMALQEGSPQFVDADKVSQFFVILMKMRHGIVPLQSLLEALLNLCTLENVAVVHKTLRILHSVLQHLSYSTRSGKRNNVLIDHSQNRKYPGDTSIELEQENKSIILSTMSSDLENLGWNEDIISRTSVDLSSEMLIIILEKMQQISLSNKEECIQTEALSIVNLLLMASSPSDIEKFNLEPLLEGMPQLLQKKAGLYVQEQAVRLLFLLLNCQKMTMMFNDWQRDDSGHAQAADSLIVRPIIVEKLTCILLGLAECLACAGASNQVLKLRRNVIIILAFIASSGKSGFDVLLYPATPQGENFLELIIRLLAFEIDTGKNDDTKSQDHCEERTLLVREGLILLNRLVSNPAYAKATLSILTSSPIARLTINVANRMPKRSRSHQKYDGTKTLQMEAEIIDLARLFKARVCAFLGENNT